MARSAASPIAVVVLVLAGLLAPPFARVSYACSCMRTQPSLTQMVDRASAVFLGRVIAIERTMEEETVPGFPLPGLVEGVHARLEVLENWKGAAAPVVDVWTGIGSGDCGYPFQFQDLYLVFGSTGQDGRLYTNICSNTKSLDRAAADHAALGAGTRPTAVTRQSGGLMQPASSPLPETLPFQPWVAVGVAAVLVPVSVGAWWLAFGRRRRRPSA